GPDALAEPMDAALSHSVQAADAGLRAGASALVVADDLAGSEGPLLDPAFLRAAVFPRLAVLTALADESGVPSILHSDGDARALMPATAAAGFVAVHGDCGGGRHLESSLAAARVAGLAMIGGIPTAALADEDTARAAGVRAGAFAATGGLLPADDGGVATVVEARALLGALGAISRG
ncbi:MAG TPA: uroporphyrinogen decarboxylase family protein, partial [Coriobacteriia bacterium]